MTCHQIVESDKTPLEIAPRGDARLEELDWLRSNGGIKTRVVKYVSSETK